MTWCWLEADGEQLRWWPKGDERPTPRALRVDERLVAGGGAATWVSYCDFEDAAHSFAFDDGAVTQAIRRRHLDPWPEAVSSLLVNWSRIGGTITSATSRSQAAIDPFARVFPRQRVFRIERGTLGPIPAPTGPGVTRYGSGNPWPWDRYAGQVE